MICISVRDHALLQDNIGIQRGFSGLDDHTGVLLCLVIKFPLVDFFEAGIAAVVVLPYITILSVDLTGPLLLLNTSGFIVFS